MKLDKDNEPFGLSKKLNLIYEFTYRLSGGNTDGSSRKSTLEEFWLPKVSGALGKEKKPVKTPGQFQHVVSFKLSYVYSERM